jgi:hypothetical protein
LPSPAEQKSPVGSHFSGVSPSSTEQKPEKIFAGDIPPADFLTPNGNTGIHPLQVG